MSNKTSTTVRIGNRMLASPIIAAGTLSVWLLGIGAIVITGLILNGQLGTNDYMISNLELGTHYVVGGFLAGIAALGVTFAFVVAPYGISRLKGLGFMVKTIVWQLFILSVLLIFAIFTLAQFNVTHSDDDRGLCLGSELQMMTPYCN